MKITVVGGTGYVGLTTAVCLAIKDHTVYCIGRNEKKIRQLLAGKPLIFEESLDKLLKDALNRGTFVPSTNLEGAIRDSDLYFICVGTPSQADGNIDLSQIETVSKEIGLALKGVDGYKVIAVKSTVVPGTTENLVAPTVEKFSNKKAGFEFGVCMNPEFLREGKAVKDFLFPNETGIVIGELDEKSGDVLYSIYEDFETEILRTTIKAAEMIKYARNSYLAKDISFANEIANICQRLGVDYLEVKRGMELDARIGEGRFLDAGAGFGGSCFPKDVKALTAKVKEMGIKPRMLEATLQVNEAQPLKIVELTKQVLGQLRDKRIGVLGLAFKPGTDDMREAVSIKVIRTLLREGADVSVYDPKALNNAKHIFGDKISYMNTAEKVLVGADACVIVTEWPEFADPKLYNQMRSRVIIDGRRVLDPNKLDSGSIYHAVGFPKAVKT